MKLSKCSRGHYYDMDIDKTCPLCDEESPGFRLYSRDDRIYEDYKNGKIKLNNPLEAIDSDLCEDAKGFLKCTNGVYKGKSFDLRSGDPVLIGRTPNCQIFLVGRCEPRVCFAIIFDKDTGNYKVFVESPIHVQMIDKGTLTREHLLGEGGYYMISGELIKIKYTTFLLT